MGHGLDEMSLLEVRFGQAFEVSLLVLDIGYGLCKT